MKFLDSLNNNLNKAIRNVGALSRKVISEFGPDQPGKHYNDVRAALQIPPDQREAIKSAFAAPPSATYGKALYQADPRSPWNAMQDGASLKGSPSTINSFTAFGNNGAPYTITTVTMGDKVALKNSEDPHAERVCISITSLKPIELNITENFTITQTRNGVRVNGILHRVPVQEAAFFIDDGMGHAQNIPPASVQPQELHELPATPVPLQPKEVPLRTQTATVASSSSRLQGVLEGASSQKNGDQDTTRSPDIGL